MLFLFFLFATVEATCDDGDYLYNNSICIPCPAGSTGSNGICTQCGNGTYQNIEGQTTCFDCPDKHLCTNGTRICAAGEFLPYGAAGENLPDRSNDCIKCQPGTFSAVNGSVSCDECASDKYQTESGKTSCIACPELTQSNGTHCNNCSHKWSRYDKVCIDNCTEQMFGNGRICEFCDAGQYYNDSICTDCPRGYIKPTGSPMECFDCSSRHSWTNTTHCTRCRENQQVVDFNCTDCEPGTYLFGDSCTNCSVGYYQTNGTNQINETTTFCQYCPKNTYQDQSGQNDCKHCDEGKVTTSNECQLCSGRTGYNGTDCVACDPGEISNGTGYCQQCPTGWYQGGSTCRLCRLGSYQDQANQTGCKSCSEGKYSNTTGQVTCQNCTGNEETNLRGKGSTYCCPNGTCSDCGAGKKRVPNQEKCEDCPVGKYSGSASSACTGCPVGYFTNKNESHTCERCADGSTSLLDLTGCIECTAGKYEQAFECVNCPKGEYQDQTGQTMCKSCAFPMTTNSTNTTNSSDCTNCTTGLGLENGECVTCGAGKYLENAVCENCPLGFITSDPNTNTCIKCDGDSTTVEEGASTCTSCTDCDCAPGSYGSSCKECPRGWWSSGGENCIACSARTYQDQEGQYFCKNCAAGKFSDTSASTACESCPNGFFQDKDAQGSCHDCPIGRFSDRETDRECEQCPDGSTTAGQNSQYAGDCSACKIGKAGTGGICNVCTEGQYQDVTNQTECKACPAEKWSEPGSLNETDCFKTGKLITYTFGNMEDHVDTKSFDSMCEIRPNFVLYCPACSCNADSRRGFWSGPFCSECQRGFATRYCNAICPGYDGQHDSTICNGNGRCWFGRFGNGLCYCGGGNKIDTTGENVFVDVRICPRGQICPGYGSSSVDVAEYIPQYYIIQYRQYSTFVLQMSKYTPARGHMWFKRFPPSKAAENTCSLCTGKYEDSLMTEVGYWANSGDYSSFPPAAQTNRGFHGENCQHECAVCLNNGYCVHSPHPYRYSYTIDNTYVNQRQVIIPTTACVCRSSVFDASQMCCPNGFQPYVYYGRRNTDPYSSFDTLPFISSIDNIQDLGYYRDKDLWLETADIYQPTYVEPEDGQIFVAERADIKNVSYSETGPYNKHIYHGTTREICRACPGLFGKGVRAQDTLVQTEQEAEEYWWDFAASAGDKKCAGQGVCDFYAKERETDVDFMGNKNTWSLLYRGVLCRTTPSFQFQPISKPLQNGTDQQKLEECVAKANDVGASYVGFAPEYYIGGSDFGERFSSLDAVKLVVERNNHAGWAKQTNTDNTSTYYVVTVLPRPDSDSNFQIYANVQKPCIAFQKCETFTRNSYEFNIYDVTRGRGDDRFHRKTNNIVEKSSFDRFDTCFTYTKDDKRAQFGLTLTVDYVQGQDPFVGGLCPRGYFCSQQAATPGFPSIGYKEACPPGYYQPQFGATRTDPNVQCSENVHETQYEISTSTCSDASLVVKTMQECEAAAASFVGLSTFVNNTGTTTEGCHITSNNETAWNPIIDQCTGNCVCQVSNPCQSNVATFATTDYVDKICKRCSRYAWSAEGAFECHECPKGFVKKISGNFAKGNIKVYNMLPSGNNTWYYIKDEMGNQEDDCARVPPGIVHVPKLNIKMQETATNKQFLPLISCPYGFSNQPGTYIIQDKWNLRYINTDEAFMVPPFVKNLGVMNGVVSNVPCACKHESGVEYEIPDQETCWEYARSLSQSDGATLAGKMDTSSTFWDGCVKFKNSDVVHWSRPNSATYAKNYPKNIQFFCTQTTIVSQLVKEIAAQYCFPCPGDSVTGPESGICTTCSANQVKKNMKLTLQKIVERSYPRLYKCYDTNVDSTNVGSTNDDLLNGSIGVPTDEIYTCKPKIKALNDTRDDIVYKEENVQAWQFIKDTNSIWKVDSVFWPILQSNQTLLPELVLSDCILACSTTWGAQWDVNRTVRVGFAYEVDDRHFCLCNDGGENDTYYRSLEPDETIVSLPKYANRNVTTSIKKLLWYEAQVEDNWVDKSMPLCGSCTPGTVLSNNKCEFCTPGTYTSTVEETMLVDCVACPSGYYQNTLGQSYCKQCMIGMAEPRTSQTSCDICVAGYYEDQRAMGSDENTYTNVKVNGTGWVDAPDDGSGYVRCKSCPSGYYQTIDQQAYCLGCTAGYFQDEPAQTRCDDCPRGWSQPNENSAACDECDMGKYQNTEANSACIDCATGQYENEKGEEHTCKLCPIGEFQNEIGKPGCKNCKPDTLNALPDGNPYGYSNEPGLSKCKKCDPGDTCTASSSTTCPSGSVNPNSDSSIAIFSDTCHECTGRTASNSGRTKCQDCIGPKHYPSASGILCAKCPKGSHSYEWSESGKCTECKLSEYIDISTATCVSCASYEVRDPDDDTKCKPCGTKQIANNGVCQTCSVGKKPNGDQNSCISCIKPWSELFKGYSGYTCLDCLNNKVSTEFQLAVSGSSDNGCYTSTVAFKSQVFCWASWKITFTKPSFACFSLKNVKGIAGVYVLEGTGKPSLPPSYIKKTGCHTNHGNWGCAWNTDFGYVLERDPDWKKRNIVSTHTSQSRCQPSKTSQAGKTYNTGDKATFVVMYFNPDRNIGQYGFDIEAYDGSDPFTPFVDGGIDNCPK